MVPKKDEFLRSQVNNEDVCDETTDEELVTDISSDELDDGFIPHTNDLRMRSLDSNINRQVGTQTNMCHDSNFRDFRVKLPISIKEFRQRSNCSAENRFANLGFGMDVPNAASGPSHLPNNSSFYSNVMPAQGQFIPFDTANASDNLSSNPDVIIAQDGFCPCVSCTSSVQESSRQFASARNFQDRSPPSAPPSLGTSRHFPSVMNLHGGARPFDASTSASYPYYYPYVGSGMNLQGRVRPFGAPSDNSSFYPNGVNTQDWSRAHDDFISSAQEDSRRLEQEINLLTSPPFVALRQLAPKSNTLTCLRFGNSPASYPYYYTYFGSGMNLQGGVRPFGAFSQSASYPYYYPYVGSGMNLQGRVRPFGALSVQPSSENPFRHSTQRFAVHLPEYRSTGISFSSSPQVSGNGNNSVPVVGTGFTIETPVQPSSENRVRHSTQRFAVHLPEYRSTGISFSSSPQVSGNGNNSVPVVGTGFTIETPVQPSSENRVRHSTQRFAVHLPENRSTGTSIVFSSSPQLSGNGNNSVPVVGTGTGTTIETPGTIRISLNVYVQCESNQRFNPAGAMNEDRRNH